MRESNLGEAELLNAYSGGQAASVYASAVEIANMSIVPFFSMRKLRLVFNELSDNAEFEFKDFEAFKQHVLASVAPQLELSKWQAIAARR